MHPAAVDRTPLTRRDGLAALALAAAAFVTFWPALGCEFVAFDDQDYVTENPNVTEGLSVERTGRAFAFHAGNWHPLTWLSLQLDASLGGPGPFGFHLTNVLLHAANAALLFLALRALTGAFWRSAAAALLFAVHPLRVESVAWVAERKDVLSAAFGVLALLAYAGYARAPSVGRYLAVWVALLLSLMAKPMLVTLPCLLLVLDWWPLRRVRVTRDAGRLAAEKLPLLALAAASCALTFCAQKDSGAVGTLESVPFGVRVANAAVGYAAYLSKTVRPTDLAVFYPHPGAGLAAAHVAGAVLLLAALTAVAVALRVRAPYLLAGWLWFVGTLVPVIGLVQVGSQAYADRYTYLPQVGLLLAACWGAADLVRARPGAALAAAGAAAAALAVLAWNQEQVWHDSLRLWDHALRVAEPSPTALLGHGAALEKEGRLREAAVRYRQVLEIEPNSVLAQTNLGNLLFRQGNLEQARQLLEKVCHEAPHYALAHTYLGNVLFRQGKPVEAAREHEEAIRLKPELAGARFNLGGVEFARGRLDRARECYREALRLNPQWGEAHLFLGQVLQREGNVRAAAVHFELAAKYNPDSAPALFGLGTTCVQLDRLVEAADWLAKAVEREPSSPNRLTLAAVLHELASRRAEAGRTAEAAGLARRALAEAAAAGDSNLAGQIESRLRRYERGEAGRNPPGAAP